MGDGLRDHLSCTETVQHIHSSEPVITHWPNHHGHKTSVSPTGMVEVVTAVAWEECEAMVMVTIVLLVIWV